MKYFVFSDVHGEYNKLISALKEAEYDASNENHCLVSLGDNFDRGEQSAQILEFLVSSPRIHTLLGNHEVFLLDFMLEKNKEAYNFNYLHNGLSKTLKSLAKITAEQCDELLVNNPDNLREKIRKNYPILIKFLESMTLIFQTKTHILVHASLGENGDLKKLDKHTALWDRETIKYDYAHLDKTVVFGHVWAWKNRNIITNNFFIDCSTFVHENKVSIDGCSNILEGVVNIYIFEED